MQKLVIYDSTWQPIIELDLGSDESIPLDYGLGDPRIAGNKKGNHSKTFKLPGTNKNNKYFGGLYDVNTTYDEFNPNVRVNGILTIDSEELMRGFIQLRKITFDDKGMVEYNVVMFDSSVQLFESLGEATLWKNQDPADDIDFSELDHLWQRVEMENSWYENASWPSTAWEDLGYYYPLLQGHTLQANVNAANMYPAIYHKRLLDMIITQAGFTWSGTLKTNEVYEREVIPFTGEYDTTQILEENGFHAGSSQSTIEYYNLSSNTGVMNDYIDDDPFDSYPPSAGFVENNTVWDATSFGDDTFNVDVSGLYNFSHLIAKSIQIEINRINTTPNLFLDLQYFVEAAVYDGGGSFVFGQSTLVTEQTVSIPSGSLGTSIVTYSFTSPPVNVFSSPVLLEAGWTVELKRRVNCNNGLIDSSGIQASASDITVNQIGYFYNNLSYLSCNDMTVQVGTASLLLPYEGWIDPKIKKKDIIKDLQARYGIYMYPNADVPNDIVIDVAEDFLSDTSVIEGITKEENEPSELTLVSELQSKTLTFSYTKSDDDPNKQYTDITGETFGQYKYRFGNEFVKGDKKLETPFKPTPLEYEAGLHCPALNYYDRTSQFRVLYANSTTPPGAGGANVFALTELGSTPPTNYYNYYPYAGHLSQPFDPENSIDINFGQVAYLPNMTHLPANAVNQSEDNLVSRNWNKYLDLLINGKRMVGKFHVTSKQMYEIRKNPSARIWIDNAYWIVAKAKFEGNDKLRGLTTMELITSDNNPVNTIDDGETPSGGAGGSTGGTPPSGLITNPQDNTVAISSKEVFLAGTGNVLGEHTKNISVTGDENTVSPYSEDVSIVKSSNNTVSGSNVLLINSSGHDVVSDNVSIIDNVLHYTETLRTTDGVSTNIFTEDLTQDWYDNKIISVKVEVMAGKFSDGTGLVGIYNMGVKQYSGTATQIGSTDELMGVSDIPSVTTASNVICRVSSNNLEVFVIGALGVAIGWKVKVSITASETIR